MQSTHACCAKGCTTVIQAELLMCKKHWRMVPKEQQQAVWRYYRRGQSMATADVQWRDAAERAILTVFEKEQRRGRQLSLA